MRKALVVGINYYEKSSPLYGCVNDAYSVKEVLSRNADGSKNFEVRLKLSSNKDFAIDKESLEDQIEELFKYKSEIALFYFAGHGYVEDKGGYLITSDCKIGDDGVAMIDILHHAVNSPATNKIIILDSCYSGKMGTIPSLYENKTLLSKGMAMLTASRGTEASEESGGYGVFTSLLVDALNGGASNLIGDVTLGSVYAHVDQSLGAWDQRPLFKANISGFTSLRKVDPPIELKELKTITKLFPLVDFEFQLDRTYEPERCACTSSNSLDPIEENVEKFRILQSFNRVNLVVPVGAPHMWHAAWYNKSCKLTALGQHYWNLVVKGRI